MVERFFGPDEPWPNELGDLVRYSDYAALEAERDRLTERVAELEKVRAVAVDALKWLSNAARYDKTVTVYAIAAMSQINGYSGGSV